MPKIVDLWPVVIVQDRYGHGWVALADADSPEVLQLLDMGAPGPWGGDADAYEFFDNPGPRAAYGETPEKALENLKAKTGTNDV